MRYTTLIRVLFCIALAMPFAASATTYYVDATGGSDGSAGTTSGTAWQTIAHVNAATFSPGDSILFKKGQTWHEQLQPPSSGTVGNPITFSSYGSGSDPIISGADVISGFTSLGSTELGGLFVSGFETGDTSDFTSSTVTGTNALTVQSTTKNHAVYALKAQFSGTVGDKSARVNKTLTTSDDVYARMYFYLDSAFDLAANATRLDIMYLRLDSSTNRARVGILRDASGNFYLQGRIETPSVVTFYTGTPGELSKGAWHYLELRYKGNSATGGAQLWLDGVSLGSNYVQNTTGLQVGRVEIGANSSSATQPTAGSLMYIDDVVASTTPIGAFAPIGSATTYVASGVTWTARQVFEDGSPLASGTDSGSLIANQYFLDTVANKLYVRLTGDADPAAHVMEASRRNTAINVLLKNYLVFDGLTAQQANNSSYAGIYFSTTTNSTIINSTLKYNYGSGVNLIYGSNNNIIGTSTFSGNDREFGGSVRMETSCYDNVVEHNTMSGLINGTRVSNGINIRGDNGESARNIVRYNLIHDVYDSGIYIHNNANDNQVYGNLIYSVDDHDAGSSGGNGIHLGNDSGWLTPDHGNIVYNNVIFDMATHGITLREGSYSNLIYNNTIYNVGVNRGTASGNTASGSGVDLHSSSNTVGSGPHDNTIKNNIVAQCASNCLNLDSFAVTGGGNVIDYNLFYNTLAVPFKWNGTTYATLSLYQAASSLDTHSLYGDPLFTSTSTNVLTLQTASPAIDVGTTLSATYARAFSPSSSWPSSLVFLDQSSNGSGWEIGAYVFPDIVAPTVSSGAPSSAQASGTTSVTLSVFTNENATCKYSTTSGTAYGAMTSIFSTTGGTTHSQSLNSLSDGTSYTYYVRCSDQTGNADISDYSVSFSIDSAPAVVSTASAGGNGSPFIFGMNTPVAANPPPMIVLPQIQASSTVSLRPVPSLSLTRTLSYGITHAQVRISQRMLVQLGFLSKDGITGYFGPRTRKAVQAFQENYQLATKGRQGYGVIGPKTLAKLNSFF